MGWVLFHVCGIKEVSVTCRVVDVKADSCEVSEGVEASRCLSCTAGKEQKPSSEASVGNKPKDAMQRLRGSLLHLDKVLWARLI